MKRIFKKALSLFLAVVLILSGLSLSAFAVTYMGDVNTDGKINSNDALLILQCSTGLAKLNTTQLKIADLTGESKVNSSDALLVLQTATGLIDKVIFQEDNQVKLPYEGRVTADPTLRLRAGAGTSYEQLATIPYGTVLTITKISNNWGQTTYEGKTGWVSLEYIEPVEPVSGTFTVTAYGYGHGVGMSQEGAMVYANDGWKYDKILLHYFYSDKTKILKDENMPETVEYGGEEYDLKRYIAGSVRAEIGYTCHIEAIKAQMVAIYTYAKYYGFDVSKSTHAYKEFDYKGTKIETALNEVLGEYIDYNGKAILAVYCASMGGKNTSAKNAWNGTDLAYLQGGRISPESESTMKRTYTFTADEVRTMVAQGLGITLTGSPDTWFTDIVHDKSISNSIGYIRSMKVGGQTVYGERVRSKVFQYNVRSHCLSIKYNK